MKRAPVIRTWKGVDVKSIGTIVLALGVLFGFSQGILYVELSYQV
jgi:hypothetical protein